MSCYLWIIGENLDIDLFAQKTQMLWPSKKYKGDTVNAVNKRKVKYSSLSISTSDANFNDIKTQIDETIAFLCRYKSDLIHIKSTPEIEFATINFGVDSLIDENRLVQSFYFPIELVNICAELGIGIELSIYKRDMEVILEQKRRKKNKNN